MVYRIYVEKKPGFDVEAEGLKNELVSLLGVSGLTGLRLLNRYDVEGIDEALFQQCASTVFSEPPVDDTYDALPQFEGVSFAVEYLPGQFDQRADSAAECIQLISQGERPLVRSARVYLLQGSLTEAQVEEIKKYVINPVEAREASLEKKDTLKMEYPIPSSVAVLDGFNELDEEGLKKFIEEKGLAMDLGDIRFCQDYFRGEHRDPTITEIRMIDTYWSDHCRHTTFGTILDDVQIDDAVVQEAFDRYMAMREDLGRTKKPRCMMDLATIGAKELKKQGILKNLDESEEINACTVKIDVDEALTLGYTGRKANGASSRGIEINEGWVGGRMSDLSIGDGQTFSVSAWVRFTSIPEGSCFFSVENRASSAWPVNNWGWMWSDLSSTGKLNSYTFRTATYNGAPELKYTFPNAVVTPNAWNHVVLTFEYNDQSQFRSKFYLNGVLQESTWVLDGASGTTETWANVNYSITTSDWFCFAGGRGSEPVFNNGIIDDLLVWNGAMTPEQVQNVKNGLDANSLPQEVMAYWDFETDADEDHYFAAKGSVAGAKACSFKTEALGSEGAGRQVAQNPLYISGCPFVPGSTFKVETRPTWTAKRGVLSESTGTDLEGSTKLTYSKPGDYTVTLTLENTLGADTKSYPVFKVGDVDGVEESMAGELRTYTVEGILFVEFAEDGDYQVGVYNASGMLVAQKDAAVVAGQNMSISLGAKGVYVVKVMKEGKVVRTVKVLNR